ncbi:S-layer homology domain-containing protein [Sporosarcina siberiensis]|uniref:S-layer homology domain-containing protein n=1 Tax=Sporosarcina siberiensis TaxID=1365606 RepID=A0ABW4SCS6_9BACL
MQIINNGKRLLKIVLTVLLITFITSSIPFNEAAAASEPIKSKRFKDVGEDFHAFEAINWAYASGIINGYPDGRFKPESLLTEAQFAVMLSRYYAEIDKESNKYKELDRAVWSNSFYEALAIYRIPMLGYNDAYYRNNPVMRGLIAQVISYLDGNTFQLEGAVEYLFKEGLTVGRYAQGKTLGDKFGQTDYLTRAQTATFFHRLHKKTKTEIAETVVSDKADVNTELSKKESEAKVDMKVIPKKTK